MVQIAIVLVVGGCAALFAITSQNWKERYETERDQFASHRQGGFTNDPQCLKVMVESKVAPFTLVYTNEVVLTKIITNEVPILDIISAERLYKRGLTNGVIALGNEIAEMLDWKGGHGSTTQTVKSLMEINEKAIQVALKSWKGKPQAAKPAP